MGRRCEDLAQRLWPESLQEVQDSLTRALGLPLLFVHPSGRPLAACEDLSHFCRWFTRAVALSRPCLDCGRGARLAELADSALGGLRPLPASHLCPLHLADAAVPILSAGEPFGYLVTAQSRPDSASPDTPSSDYARDADECRSFVSRLRVCAYDDLDRVTPALWVVAWLVGSLSASRRRSLSLGDRLREQGRWIQHHLTTDAVTQVANRRAFVAALEAEVLRARRYRRALSVAVLDIHDFRRINEEFGHDVGDAVLRSVAQSLSATVRQTDLVGRVGGDEFALLFPETSRPEAMIALARVTTQIGDLNASGDLPVEVRLAIGLADHTDDADDLLAAACQSARQAGGPAGLLA